MIVELVEQIRMIVIQLHGGVLLSAVSRPHYSDGKESHNVWNY